jgi:hypothetical protein
MNSLWNLDRVGVFDPDLEDNEVTAGSGDIVYMGNYLIVRDGFVLVDRIHDVAIAKGKGTVR